MIYLLRTLLPVGLFLLILAGVCPAQETDLVRFSYTGLVRVQGQAFDGEGAFKLAVVDAAGSTTLWSNDETSTDGLEPATAFPAPVENGVFNIMVGGEGMAPINRTIFNQPDRIRLRVWFSDGVHGFQRLLPDSELFNIELLALRTGTEDFTIYVDGQNGNDAANGLTTQTAKRTIQAAVDVLPERVKCNVTIDVAPGTYYEGVALSGLSVPEGKRVRILGDRAWKNGDAGDPEVEICGFEQGTATPVLPRVVSVTLSSEVVLEGLLITGASDSGAYLSQVTNYAVERCKFSDCGNGLIIRESHGRVKDSLAEGNEVHGFNFVTSVYGFFTNVTSRNNVRDGMRINHACYISAKNLICEDNGGFGLGVYSSSRANLWGDAFFSRNGVHGMDAGYHSSIAFSVITGLPDDPPNPVFNGNGSYGFRAYNYSFIAFMGADYEAAGNGSGVFTTSNLGSISD